MLSFFETEVADVPACIIPTIMAFFSMLNQFLFLTVGAIAQVNNNILAAFKIKKN
jgi:hypothetical protein